jgi:hypothetical protein
MKFHRSALTERRRGLPFVRGFAVNTCYCRRLTRPKPALRGDAFQQAKADHDFEAQELELKINTDLTSQIHVLTEELHRRAPRWIRVGTPRPLLACLGWGRSDALAYGCDMLDGWSNTAAMP